MTPCPSKDHSLHRPVEPDRCQPSEQHSPNAEATRPGDRDQVQSLRVLSDEALLRRLRALGYDPGPITVLTRRVYLRRLEELSRSPAGESWGPAILLVLGGLRVTPIPPPYTQGTALSWQMRYAPAISPTALRMRWFWHGNSTAPTRTGIGVRGC